MSADLVRGSVPSSGSSTPRSKLDALSREDLIRFVKKQIEKSRLAKAENEKLVEENDQRIKSFQESERKWEEALEKEKQEAIANLRDVVSLTEQCDSLKSTLTERSLTINELTSQLEDLKRRNEQLAIEEVKIEDDSGTCELRQKNDELRKKVSDLEETVETQKNEHRALQDLFREQTQKLLNVEKEREEFMRTAQELRSALDDTSQQLVAVKEKRNVENVFSLEIADYEKTVEKLEKELKTTKEEWNLASGELEKTREEVQRLASEKSKLASNAGKMKAAIVKLRAELAEKKETSDGYGREIEELKKEIERHNSERDEQRIQLGAAIGEAEEKRRQLEASVASLNRQLISLRSQRESLQRQYDDLVQEHSTFKLRALYVLEQKKGEDEPVKNDEVETLEETIRQQRKTIENLTQTHRVLQDELASAREHTLALSADLQASERQVNIASEQHRKQLSEQRHQFESRLASESKLNSELLAQIDANFVAHTKEKERLMAEWRKEREAMERELDIVSKSLDEERRKRADLERTRSPANVAITSTKHTHPNLDVNSSFLQRPASVSDRLGGSTEEGETEKTLEDVIYGEEKDLESDFSDPWEVHGELRNWEEVAHKTQKQMVHARELLNESEAANARLLEQTKLLKEEIRRLERNEQRTDHVANTEYLKNIIMRFIAPEKVDSERGQLIPVLATMLRLSTDEVALLNNVALGDATTGSGGSTKAAAGWGSYLHRWSGIS